MSRAVTQRETALAPVIYCNEPSVGSLHCFSAPLDYQVLFLKEAKMDDYPDISFQSAAAYPGVSFLPAPQFNMPWPLLARSAEPAFLAGVY